ncbi:hypothetical protein HDV00_006653 [Rhizophlyctis rosea]|nr:hypothetical protein HDV00_006653 [Rhizophlyctis rosea]
MFDVHTDVFIIRALTRDQRYDVEREQALKLVRTLLDIPGGVELLPQSIVRTIIAVAEQSDDKMRNVSLETLCEFGMINV